MICQRCGEQTFVIFVTEEHERLCDTCHESDKPRPRPINGKKVEDVVDEMYSKITSYLS